MKNIRGFTLIELLVVILIISFITMLAVPAALSAVRKMTFNGRVREVVSVLEEARTQALASKVIVHPDGSQKIPPGGYGVLISMPDQSVTLFIDDWNEGAAKLVDMDYFDLANRTLPDGIYTAGKDRLLRRVTLPEDWLSMKQLVGTKLSDGSAWSAADTNTLIVVYQPPYGEVIMRTDDATDLQSFAVQFELAGQTPQTRTIYLHRVTTAAKMTNP